MDQPYPDLITAFTLGDALLAAHELLSLSKHPAWMGSLAKRGEGGLFTLLASSIFAAWSVTKQQISWEGYIFQGCSVEPAFASS